MNEGEIDPATSALTPARFSFVARAALSAKAAARRTIQQRQPTKDARAVLKGVLSNQRGERAARRQLRAWLVSGDSVIRHTPHVIRSHDAQRSLG
jgi:hypothetical protein